MKQRVKVEVEHLLAKEVRVCVCVREHEQVNRLFSPCHVLKPIAGLNVYIKA